MFKFDFIDGDVIRWEKKDGRAVATKDTEHMPRFYISGDRSQLQNARTWLTSRKGVGATAFERWRPTLQSEKQDVLRVDTFSEDALKSTVHIMKKRFGRSSFRFYNIGLSPGFRYALQNDIEPVPDEDLEKIRIELPRRFISSRELSRLKIDGEKVQSAEKKFRQIMESRDPDMILVNRGEVLKVLEEELDFSLGRMRRFDKLAGENTVSSYGKTVHSASRYNIPGRIVVDMSNSFMLGEATIEGMWDLVSRSYRPMQELSWASIGRILTSIEIRKAYLQDGILTPWKNWEPEKPRKASVMHKADRGGFIFNPEPSIHHDVYEADFASLFPNIMVKRNISPETVDCECCENSDVPELDYSICRRRRGFISEVLKPLVEERQEMKEKIGDVEDEEERKYLRGSIDAIKWILVSCFGYMGHSHASYGAIKAHQAIQAYDRKIMLETKNMFEESGYRVAHGIIDSIWVKKEEDAHEFEEVCSDITGEIGIELEPEYLFDWVAFVPRSSDEGIATLNRYFGKTSDGDFKTAGIEAEQHSTPEYIAKAQLEMIEELDTRMEAVDVLQVLEEKVRKLRQGVEPEKLIIEKQVSRSLDAYQVNNRSTAAMKRNRIHGVEVKPGQKVRYVVRDDEAEEEDRVRLGFEAETYDVNFYTELLVRAAESVLSPKGWNRNRIRNYIRGDREVALGSFTR